MDRRRNLISSTTSFGSNEIFPMHLYLTKVNSWLYKLDPTPESIALVDYFLENAIYDGIASYELYLEPNLLYIDDINVTTIIASSFDGTPNNYDVYWDDSKSYFMIEIKTICWRDDYIYPKGTILVEDDG